MVPVIGAHILDVLVSLGLRAVTLPLGLIFNTGPVLFPIPPLEPTLLIDRSKHPFVQGHILVCRVLNDHEQQPPGAQLVLDAWSLIPHEPTFTDGVPGNIEVGMQGLQPGPKRGWGMTDPKPVRMPVL